VRAFCDSEGFLLIFDEVQVGIGRTGKIFAYEHYGVEPDILTLAKALAGGLPGGAMLAKNRVAESFSPGSHASTFGGNPVVMAAAVAVMKELLQGDVLENCCKMGEYFSGKLAGLKEKYPELIIDIRSKGLMLGMELSIEGKEIVERCLDEGIIINCTLNKILRFVPPLIVKEDEINRCVDVLDKIFSSC
jgi:acetylornithine/succinyldiaminopimelate/putrescine aminotransferase